MALSDRSAAYLTQWAKMPTLFADTDNAAAIASIVKFGTRVTAFNTDYASAQLLASEANASIAGYTIAKDTAKLTTAELAAQATGGAVAYAIDMNFTALELQMQKLTTAYLSGKVDDVDFAGVILDINTTLQVYTNALVPNCTDYFTNAMLIAMMGAGGRTDYMNKLNLFRNAENAINSSKNLFESDMIPTMNKHKKYFKGFLSQLSTGFQSFVTNFQATVNKLVFTGTKLQGVDVAMTYLVSGLPVILNGNLKITDYPVVKVPKSADTNASGIIPTMSLRIGTWNALLTAPGCVPQNISIKVTSKKTVHLIIKMVLLPTV